VKTYADLTTPRTQDAILADRIRGLQGIGIVTQAGGLTGLGGGTGSLLLSGVAQATAAIVIAISTGGEPNDGTAAYELSLDGGVNFAPPATIPAGAVAIGTTGARVVFVAGDGGGAPSFAEGDTYAFQVATPVFDASAWQDETVPKRLMDLETGAAADADESVAAIAQGAYLKDAVGGWADLHAKDVFDEPRHDPIFAQGRCVLTDTAGAGPVTIQPGQLWAGPSGGVLQFSNLAGGTLPLNGSLPLTFQAENPGAAWNLGNGAISALLTPIPGVTIANPSRVSAVTKSRSGAPDVTAAISGTLGGDYDVQVVITTGGALGAAVFKFTLNGGLAWTTGVTVPGGGGYTIGATGLVLTFAAGTYQVSDSFSFDSSVSWLSQTGVDRESDDSVKARCRKKWSTLGVGEPNAAFEAWAQQASAQVTKVLSRASPTVAGQIEVWLGGPGGSVSSDVVAAVDAYLQPLVGLTCTLLVQSATSTAVALVGAIYVKAGQLGRAQATALKALAEYQAATPIGGNLVGGVGIVSLDVLVGCFTGGSNQALVVDVNLSAPAADVTLGSTATPMFDVTGVNWVET